jgi:outer membrane protein TolC
VNNLIEKALSSRLEIQEVERDVWAKENDVKASQSGYYPQLDLRGEYHWIGYDEQALDQAWEDLQEDYWSVFLVAKYNLFEGFYTQNKVRQAKASLNAAKSQRGGTRTIIIHEVAQAYTTLKSRSDEVTGAERNVSLAQRNLDAVLKEFELGVATVDKVADYSISLASARRRHVISLIDFEIAEAKLKWAVGDELP